LATLGAHVNPPVGPAAAAVILLLGVLSLDGKESRMRSLSLRLVAFACVALAALLAWPCGVAADRAYHTEQLALEPVAGAPLQSGFVVNAHADGGRVYANERYVLAGAEPDVTYQVTLLLFPGDPTCAGAGTPIPTAELATNAAGNGEAQARFSPADVPPDLRGTTIGGLWQVSLDGAVAYETACTAITLD
jgi:hypothetical protein